MNANTDTSFQVDEVTPKEKFPLCFKIMKITNIICNFVLDF